MITAADKATLAWLDEFIADLDDRLVSDPPLPQQAHDQLRRTLANMGEVRTLLLTCITLLELDKALP